MGNFLALSFFLCGAWGTIFAQNHAPTVYAGNDTTTRLGLNFSFVGARSSDPDSTDVLTYSWTVLSGATNGATLNSPSSLRSSVTFSRTGTYLFQITASDGALSASDSITITVRDSLSPRVLTPEPGSVLPVGSTYEITYEINNPGSPVNIILTTDNGRTTSYINQGGVRYGTYPWTIDQAPSDSCYLEIRSYTSNQVLAQSGRFSIVSSSKVRGSIAARPSLSTGAARSPHRLVIQGATSQGIQSWNLAGRSKTVHGRHAAGPMVE